ncbi:MAG: hypothetical protein IPM36_08365 [Lewinellaceae bacterium]|nr:hypothetical protein [Lewinellaceae bacterium]
MNQNISSKEGLDIIRSNQVLLGKDFSDDFIFNFLLDSQEKFNLNIRIENCIFNKNFVAHLGDYFGSIMLKNCVFNGLFVFHALTIYNSLDIDGSRFLNNSDMDCGSIFGKVSFLNNVFEAFVDFQDQDFKDAAFFTNNRFLAGTNLMHPKGGPSGAHFAIPPYLEGNTGLDQYERPE